MSKRVIYGVAVDGDTTIRELASSVLRKAVRSTRRGQDPLEFELVLQQPGRTYDPRSEAPETDPPVLGIVTMAVSVKMLLDPHEYDKIKAQMQDRARRRGIPPIEF